MICRYLRHIDLIAAYQELNSYNLGHGAYALANIHHDLSVTVAIQLESRAVSTIELLYGSLDAWRDPHPADVAAEVSDYIERDMEELADRCGIPLPACEELTDDEWLEQFQAFAAVAVCGGTADYFELQALLLCLYDCACWLHGRGDIEGLMSILPMIEEAAAGIARALEEDAAPSRQARNAAKKRHAESNRQRELAIADWLKNGATYSSKSAFSRLKCKEYDVLPTTLLRWITAHQQATGKGSSLPAE